MKIVLNLFIPSKVIVKIISDLKSHFAADFLGPIVLEGCSVRKADSDFGKKKI